MPDPPSVPLPSRRILLTGATGGLGRAACELLAGAGARLGLVARRPGPLEELAAGLTASGADVFTVAADLAAPGGAERVAAALRDRWGGLEGIAHLAGVVALGRSDELAPETWDRVIAADLTAPWLLFRACLPLLRTGDRPSVVMVASTLGLAGIRGGAAYCAAKGGLVNLVRALALDHAPEGIRVHALCPGPVRAGMLLEAARARGEGFLDRLRERHPAGRLVAPGEVARVLAWLLSPGSEGLTGEVTVVDGGFTAGFLE